MWLVVMGGGEPSRGAAHWHIQTCEAAWFNIFHQPVSGDALHLAGGEAEAFQPLESYF